MGTYRVVTKLAAGGMAEVFLARMVGAEGFERPVAVKRILPALAADTRFTELFLREARVSVLLQHANVVQVLDLGSASGQYYMVLEFVDGENLRALLTSARRRKVSLGLREICFITHQVAEGLAYAHGRHDASGAPLHIIHRDINPSNVMLTSTGEIKLADFGIAKMADNNGPQTQTGVLKGKINYLSPELVLGRAVDQRSDIFLLGLLLYEMLAGRQLFEGTVYLALVQKIATFDERKLEPLPGVPLALWDVLLKALAASPDARYRTAREFADALQGFLFDHRLRVGTTDIAQLFGRLFPDRRSPLEELKKGGAPEAEIRLEGREAPRAPAVPAAAPPRPEVRRPPTPPLPPPVLHRAPRPPGGPPRLKPSEPPRLPATEDTARAMAAPPGPPVARPVVPRAARRLGDILVARKLLSPEKLEEALALQKKRPVKLGQLLVMENLVPSEDITRALAEQGRLPYITDEQLQKMEVPAGEVLGQVPWELCERLCTVPVTMRGRELFFAMLEPRDLKALDSLKFAVGSYSVQGILASEFAIRRAIRRFYPASVPPEPLGGTEESEIPTQQRVMHFVEQYTGRQMVEFNELDLAQESPAPAPVPAPAARPASSEIHARVVLVVADVPAVREAAVTLLAQQGLAAAASPAASAEQALALGGHELVLLAGDTLEDAPALAARLRAAHPRLEVRALSSLGLAMAGEDGPLVRMQRTQARLFESAMSLLGGGALLAPFLVRLAQGTAARMGASGVQEVLAGTAAQVLALASRMEHPQGFHLPSLARVWAMLGGKHSEVLEVLEPLLPDGARAQEPLGRVAAATLCAAVFVQRVQSAQPSPAEVTRALAELRKDSRLPAAALEALAGHLAESVVLPADAPRVVVLETDQANAVSLQLRLMKEGLSVRFARTRAEAEQALQSGAKAAILASPLPEGDVNALVRALRARPSTASMPLFLLAATADPAEVTAGLEAGADDVLVRPVSVEVLAAKLRRALALRQT